MSNYGEYNTKELKKLQKVLTEMLKDVNYVCDKYKIDYFALDGTGIGAMRHKGFIPWDDDIDLRFFEDDLNRFIECMSKEMPDKYYFIDIDNSGYPVAFTKMCKKGTLFLDDISKELGLENGIFIDLIRMVYVSEDEKTRKKAFKKSWIIYKLGTICAIKNPSISIKGIKGKVLKVFFVILHYLMKLLHVSYKKLFYKGEKAVRVDHKTSKTISLNTVKMYSYLFNLSKKEN